MKFIIEKQEAEKQAEIEMAKIRIENQENLLKSISWELHDNIGQLLSVSKMQLSMLPEQPTDLSKKMVNDTLDVLSRVLEDVRSLSKSLNTDSVGFMGLVKATGFEIDRLNRIKFLNAKFNITGKPYPLKSDDEIVLFRILQELISNVIKHAKASEFDLHFHYSDNGLEITAQDDGIGMDISKEHYGIGLKNIVSRIKFLNGSIDFHNKNEGGVLTSIKYTIKDPDVMNA